MERRTGSAGVAIPSTRVKCQESGAGPDNRVELQKPRRFTVRTAPGHDVVPRHLEADMI
jgi:hypothetical protein